jgi:hypothetical protein
MIQTRFLLEVCFEFHVSPRVTANRLLNNRLHMFHTIKPEPYPRTLTSPLYNHRIKIHIEGPLTSEALKFLFSRMSHYACWPPFSYPVNDIFWPINTLYWPVNCIFLHKKCGHVAPLSGPSVTDLYSVVKV